MKISVLGAGNIGGTLGGKWAAKGHDVVFGVRDPQADKVRVLLEKVGHGATAVSTLIADTGLNPIYIGGIDQADILDALTRLWFVMAFQQGRGRHLAFKMIGG